MKKTNTNCRCINKLLNKKFLLTMKLITLILTVCVVHISANSYSQSQKISMNVKSAMVAWDITTSSIPDMYWYITSL